MSVQVPATKTTGHGFGRALAGVVFTDFIGVLLFAVPEIGWFLGLVTMFTVSPLVAWLALEEHPRRRALTWQFGVCNALFLIVAVTALFLLAMYMLSQVQFG